MTELVAYLSGCLKISRQNHAVPKYSETRVISDVVAVYSDRQCPLSDIHILYGIQIRELISV